MNDPTTSTHPLFEPITINRLTIRNRLVLAPMAVLNPEPDGRPSDETIAFLTTRARGGIGMIIVSTCGTQRCAGEYGSPMLRLDIEEHLPSLRAVADAVHAHDVPLIAQITPLFGRMGSPKAPRPLISASARNIVIPQDALPKGLNVPGGLALPTPQEATIEELRELEQETVASALRAQRAGWDGVEIPAHSSYFLASFLSPWTNWRSDEYGGTPENRARIVTNIVRAIRAQTGPNFPIGLRISCCEPVEGGQSPEEFARIARLIVDAGVDYVALLDGSSERLDRIFSAQDGGMVESGAARTIKQALPVPVLLQGLHDPVGAARAVAQGHGDMVILGRPLLADPEYPNKVRESRLQDIVICNRDNHCLHRTMLNLPAQCPLNPALGNESRHLEQVSTVQRLLSSSREQAMLKLSGAGSLMKLATKLMLRKKK